MVSFQCHACGDVVKKPKLDQHHGRCSAGFDCIDCSVTFATPIEYKSHTSCISEAEKYQKGLYNGHKNGREHGNNNAVGGGRGGRGGFQGRGRGHGRGGFQGRGGRPRDEGTGANGTPLGTPRRMSPVTMPVTYISSEPKTEKASAPVALPSSDTAPAPSPMKNEENGPDPSSPDQPKKEKKQKDKKSKSKSKSKDSSGEAKANDPTIVERVFIPPPPSPDKPMGTIEKKKDRKKRKGVETEGAPVAERSKVGTDKPHANKSDTVMENTLVLPPLSDKATGALEKREKKKRKGTDGEQTPAAMQSKVDADLQGKNDDSKEKKKKKKTRGDHASDDPKTDGLAQTEGNTGKCEDEAPVGDNSKVKADGREDVKSKGKQKKSKEKVPNDEASKVDSEEQGENEESKEGKKKKKCKSEVLDEPVTSAESVGAPLQSEGSEKSRKRKRDGGRAEDGDIGDRKKTKKKDSHGADMTPAAVEVKDSTPSNGKKRKRAGMDDNKDIAPISEDGKKKRKDKKGAAEGVKE